MMCVKVSTCQKIRKKKRSILNRLFDEVDIASLVYFRIAFGSLMVYEAISFLTSGFVKERFIDPEFFITYFGFEWVTPLSGNGMYYVFAAMAVFAVLITIGLFYRVSMTMFFLLWMYMFLIDRSLYLNHFYLIGLISFIMIFIPAHRSFSLDAKIFKKIQSNTIPLWALRLLQIQIAIPYVYGGIAKLRPDWLQGEPMHMWLMRRASSYGDTIGPWFDSMSSAYFFSYGGIIFDLLIVPALLWKRTRWFALAAAIVFNLINAKLFTIGIFPWFMIAASLMFFDPDWPRRILAMVRGKKSYESEEATFGLPTLDLKKKAILVTLSLYLVVQFLLPFRHYLYPGVDVWTYEGYYFAWEMKLKDKKGVTKLMAADPVTNKIWEIDKNAVLEWYQVKDLDVDPDAILQLAHYFGEILREEGYDKIEIHAIANVTLNGRNNQLLIDPEVDLLKKERTIWRKDWVKELITPLDDRPSDSMLK